jgi:hypothetical protein
MSIRARTIPSSDECYLKDPRAALEADDAEPQLSSSCAALSFIITRLQYADRRNPFSRRITTQDRPPIRVTCICIDEFPYRVPVCRTLHDTIFLELRSCLLYAAIRFVLAYILPSL